MSAIIIEDEKATDNPLVKEQGQEDNQDNLDQFAQEPSTEDNSAQTSGADDLPEKYRGKSIKEIVAMHQEAEKLVGRQGDEVGQLRKIVDDYIQSEIDNRQRREEPAEEVDFFTDPDKAIEAKLNNHPAIKAAQEQARKFEQATSLAALQRKYPKIQDYLQDSAFQEWVKGSEYRQNLYSKANDRYDISAADEMFGLWEERLKVISETVQSEQTERSKAVKKSSTGSTSAARSSGSSKKTYRRADIIKLMIDDPDRYQQLQPEIMEAYAEGRVK